MNFYLLWTHASRLLAKRSDQLVPVRPVFPIVSEARSAHIFDLMKQEKPMRTNGENGVLWRNEGYRSQPEKAKTPEQRLRAATAEDFKWSAPTRNWEKVSRLFDRTTWIVIAAIVALTLLGVYVVHSRIESQRQAISEELTR